MSFSGTLDEFSPAELISILDSLGKSGKLHLTRGDEEGIVIFRRGRIIYAASSGFREILGSMLLARGLINEAQLIEALEKRAASTVEKRLGTILVDMGAVSQEDLNEVLLEQVLRTVSEFAWWDSGHFDFSRVHVVDHGEVELKPGDLWAPLGLSPNHLLLRLAQFQDEAASLNQFVGELHEPQVKGEVIHRILEQAGKGFGRCLLFSARHDGFRSIAQVGEALPEPSVETPLIEISLGREHPSILSRAASSGRTVMAKLPQEPGDPEIVDALGGPSSETSVAMPLAVRDETVLVLYGDSLRDDLPTGWLEDLEGVLLQASQMIEAETVAAQSA